MHCVEFDNLECVVFISVVCYIVGIECLFPFRSRQQDEGENNRAQPNPYGRCFPTVVDFFCMYPCGVVCY